MVQKEVNKKTSIYGIVAVLSAIVLISMVYVFGSPGILPQSQAPTGVLSNPAVSGMRTFQSTEELENYLVNSAQQGNTYYWQGTGGLSAFAPSAISDPRASAEDYSTTNIQVAGVDEADTVKTDGQYIYTISTSQYSGYYYYYGYSSQTSNSVYIISADPQNAKVVSKISFDNYTTPEGLFLSQNTSRLVVISSKYEPYPETSTNGMVAPYYYDTGSTSINIYDISNKANPVLTRNFTVSGSYFNSRMIGDYVYAVTSQSAWVYNGVVTLPVVYSRNGEASSVSPSTIYYSDMNESNYYSFTSFYGIDVTDDQQQPTNMNVLLSGASTMYVSAGNIYVTYPTWDNGTQLTSIYRVKIDGLQLSFEAQGSVPGYTINQYAMDEYNGNLRIATNVNSYPIVTFGGTASVTSFQSNQTNNVYVLNQNLTVIGKLEGLAQGENLHSVRFMGDRCYLVTFVKTDPLFVIDVSQPQNPTVLGELKIPGYSDYLHPYDETHLIGVGKEAVAADEGNFAWYQGLKLAFFDVSNVNNPVQMSNYVIGDRGTDSAVLSDPKAFLFDKEKNLLVIPVNLALVSEANKQQQGSSAYGDMVWQGAYVFSLSENGNFVLKGTVTHLNATLLNSEGHLTNYSDYYNSENQWITRSLYIGNTLYTISNTEVKLNSLTNMSQSAEINLA
jgi:inhibitor of cysteine peptidase